MDIVKSEEGSFTLESTFIFPVILLLIMTLMMFMLYMYQKTQLYYTASMTVERAAFNWDNSKRGADGIPESGEDDGLYWRISGDEMLQTLFGLTGSAKPVAVALPVERDEADNSNDGSLLTAAKLQRSANRLSSELQGELEYRRTLIGNLNIKLLQPITLEPLEKALGHSSPASSGSASIVDPVEFIRTVDLVRYYSAKFTSGVFDKQEAGDTLIAFTQRKGDAGR